jgi:hypothetical protein
VTGKEKFDNCRHRSKEVQAIDGASLSGCGSCSKVPKEGYFCWKMGIDDVNPEICGVCKSYAGPELFGNVDY